MTIIQTIINEEVERTERVRKSYEMTVDIEQIKKNVENKRKHLNWLKEWQKIFIYTLLGRQEATFTKYEKWIIYFKLKRQRKNKYMIDQKPEYFKLV